jgi:hypothetical protein
MTLFASAFTHPLNLLLLTAVLGNTAAGCSAPATQATTEAPAGPPTATSQLATLSATPITDYSVAALILKGEKQPNLSLQVTYPRLRPRPGTAPADTLGVQVFNREAKKFVESLVKEIETTARENRRDKAAVPTALQVSFKAYLLQQGLASVAFTIGQDGIGPRPITWATGLTYDLRTGHKLQAADLFRQNTAFKTLVTATVQPSIAGSDDCQLEPDNMAWDNYVLGPDAYYVLLGDAQIGRACDVRFIRMPLARLQPFAVTNSPAGRLNSGKG